MCELPGLSGPTGTWPGAAPLSPVASTEKIPGTTKLARLEENISAAEVELTPDDLREIDVAASKITVQGARYPENLERMTGR